MVRPGSIGVNRRRHRKAIRGDRCDKFVWLRYGEIANTCMEYARAVLKKGVKRTREEREALTVDVGSLLVRVAEAITGTRQDGRLVLL